LNAILENIKKFQKSQDIIFRNVKDKIELIENHSLNSIDIIEDQRRNQMVNLSDEFISKIK